uniref:beta-glucosidase n=1 Tax=Ganoderma lucidum TaxID=5315 RepID=A0A514YQT5_GANLU|nr:beta-glucosidase 7 [Ganoderma lucidum]
MALMLDSKLSALCGLIFFIISVNAFPNEASFNGLQLPRDYRKRGFFSSNQWIILSWPYKLLSTPAGTVSILSATDPALSGSSTTSAASSAIAASIATGAPVAQATTTSIATETTLITLPISSYPFSAFPIPSASPIPGVFPSTSPNSPPPPGSPLIPDFGPAWASAKAKTKTLVSTWTLEQKVNATTGLGSIGTRCVGNIAAIGDDFPGLCFEDGPVGVRATDFVTAFSAGMNAAATWNRTLIRARGKAIGQEFKGEGVNVGLGPMMNIVRVPQTGRNWEGFGADPFLSGEGAYETVLGWQEAGAQACAKHYINNEQEHLRFQESSNVDDRTEHEIHVHPFMRAIQAGIASVMCSYNLINDTFACENDRTLNQILKESSVSRASSYPIGPHNGPPLAPSLALIFGANLTAFIENGTISEARALPHDPATNQHANVQGEHFELVREIGAASVVLLKNVASALPPRKPRSLAVIGNDSGPSTRGPNGYPSNAGDDGTLAMGWGSSTASFPYLITPLEAIQQRNVDALINAVAVVNNNTVVVVHSVGPAIVEPWIENPNVTAVLWAGLPGQESGNALVDVLYRVVNPAGRLTYTIAKDPADYPAQLVTANPNTTENTGWLPFPVFIIEYTEGLHVDYRHFDANGIEPRFPFGFGLSYTIFIMRICAVHQADQDSTALEAAWARGEASPNVEGGSTAIWLHRPAFEVSFTVSNAGKVKGGELYLHFPSGAGEPLSVLRGFSDVLLGPGESKVITLTLSRYDLSVWDTGPGAQGWRKPEGTFTFSVGASSRDFRLNGTIPL